MTYKEAFRKAKKRAKKSDVSFYVVEYDYREWRTCTVVSENDSWLDSADYHAFDAVILAEVSPSGFVHDYRG